MPVINMHEAKTQLSRYVDQAASGEEIIIARAGKPVARLVSLQESKNLRVLGQGKGRFTMPENLDYPFQAELEAMFYGHET